MGDDVLLPGVSPVPADPTHFRSAGSGEHVGSMTDQEDTLFDVGADGPGEHEAFDVPACDHHRSGLSVPGFVP